MDTPHEKCCCREVMAELHAIRAQLARMERVSARKLLSQRQAAIALGISRSKLPELIARRHVRTTLVNGRVRIPATELERLAEVGIDASRAAPARVRKAKPRVGPRILDFDPRG